MKNYTNIGVFGGGGHCLAVVEILKLCGYKNISIIVPENSKVNENLRKEIDGQVLYEERLETFDFNSVFFAIGDNVIRKKVFEKTKEKLSSKICFPSLIHPKAIISESVNIGPGTVVMAGAVINPHTKIGQHCIVNTSASIDHECLLEDFTSVAPGSTLGGDVRVGELSNLGLGCSVRNGLTIGKNVVVGMGSVVVKNISDDVLGYGNPFEVKEQNK